MTETLALEEILLEMRDQDIGQVPETGGVTTPPVSRTGLCPPTVGHTDSRACPHLEPERILEDELSMLPPMEATSSKADPAQGPLDLDLAKEGKEGLLLQVGTLSFPVGKLDPGSALLTLDHSTLT